MITTWTAGYDPEKKQWSIWWLDSRKPDDLGQPVVGRLENGVGTFRGDDSRFPDRAAYE
jgi:hypothetical protein